uniref:Uncharacterized protein n=1 Tax=Macrostomum lignano TaxID=282301 RepID=A0A1I8GI58_9PLAT
MSASKALHPKSPNSFSLAEGQDIVVDNFSLAFNHRDRWRSTSAAFRCWAAKAKTSLRSPRSAQTVTGLFLAGTTKAGCRRETPAPRILSKPFMLDFASCRPDRMASRASSFMSRFSGSRPSKSSLRCPRPVPMVSCLPCCSCLLWASGSSGAPPSLRETSTSSICPSAGPSPTPGRRQARPEQLSSFKMKQRS